MGMLCLYKIEKKSGINGIIKVYDCLVNTVKIKT